MVHAGALQGSLNLYIVMGLNGVLLTQKRRNARLNGVKIELLNPILFVMLYILTSRRGA